MARLSSLQSYFGEKKEKEVNRMDPRLMLIDMIQTTKKLWEIYKTEEIRVYLEYLKDLYDREIWKIIK